MEILLQVGVLLVGAFLIPIVMIVGVYLGLTIVSKIDDYID